MLVLMIVSAAVAAISAGGGPQADGRLVIRETLPPMPRYIEGSISFLRVTHGAEVLVDGRVTVGVSVRGRVPVFSRVVEPGDYRVVSYQRPCDGNCSFLDPPVDRCAATVHVPGGETLFATIVLAQEGGCTVPSGTRRANRRWARSHLPWMRTKRARAATRARGLELRVIRRNGRDLFRTDDRILTRVNIAVRSGRVTRVVGLF